MSALRADDNDGDPAAKYLRQVANESRRAFNEIQRGEETAAAIGGPTGNVRATGLAALRKLLPSLTAPPTLPTGALPSSAFVSLTTENFETVRQTITAARSALAAARIRGDREAACCCAPKPTNAPPLGAPRKTWAEFIGVAAVRGVYGPPLSALVHTDFVGTVNAIAASCVAATHGGAWPGGEKRHRAEGDASASSSSPSASGSDADEDAAELKMTAAVTAVGGPIDDAFRRTRIELNATRFTSVAAAGRPTPPPKVFAALQFTAFIADGGGGAWIFSSLAAAHAALDPDTERLLQGAFSKTVQHCNTLFDLRPDLFAEAATMPLRDADDGEKLRWDIVRCPAEIAVDMLTARHITAVLTLIVVLGKVFRQANPALIPL